MSTADVAVIVAGTAFNLTVAILNYKRDMNHTAWFADRTRVVAPAAPPKAPETQPGNRDAQGYVRDASGRFARRDGAVDLDGRRAS